MFNKVVVRNQPKFHSSRLGIQVMMICIAVLTLGQSVGCKLGIKDAVIITYRDTVWAKRAFNLRYGNCNREYAQHFENGFCAGYVDVSNGGDGYVPALPPEEYRSYEYQSTDGSKCVNSWFEGYPAGVAAAKKDKSGVYHDVLISRMINSAVTQSKTTPVLPGDVKVVSADQANGSLQGQPQPMNNYSPRNAMPSILSPGTFADPPQAYQTPAGYQSDPADYSMSPEFSAATSSTKSSNLSASDPNDVVDDSSEPLRLPMEVAPVSWDKNLEPK